MFRRLYSPSMWNGMERLQQEMNQSLNEASPSWMRPLPGFPAINVWANEDGQMVTAELPGVEMKDMEISVAGQTLTINGRHETDEPAEDGQYHRRERGCGNFSRSVSLPYPVDTDRVAATFERGALCISLPRAEADKPKKISVKSAA
jgi:HSP20 family protein